MSLSSFAGALALVLCVAGCGEGAGPGDKGKAGTGAKVDILPPLARGVRIVVEAEDGVVEAPMVVEDFKPTQHEVAGKQEASGGKCVFIPKGTNPKPKEGEVVTEAPKGKDTLKFSIPKDGKYYIHSRCYWQGGCWNSLTMILDDRKPMEVTDSTEYKWTWVKFTAEDANDSRPRAFTLTKGEHTLVFANREDGTRLDQVYITDDPDDSPSGVMKKE